MAQIIDLNCDLGEGAGRDAELMPLIASANIACGAHAGDVATMRETIALARRHGVEVGAHPGFADREHFGRRELALTPGELRATLIAQLEAFAALSAFSHVKLHGALYNLAARDRAVAEIAVDAIRAVAPAAVIFTLAGSEMVRLCERRGIAVAREAFCDRTYQRDGLLTPRSQPDALIHDEALAVAQALRLVGEGVVRATDGSEIPLQADTICLHGDGPHGVAFARRLRAELSAVGIAVRAFAPSRP